MIKQFIRLLFLLIIIIVLSSFMVINYYDYYHNFEVESISFDKFNVSDKTASIILKKKSANSNVSSKCVLRNNDNNEVTKYDINNDICILNVPINGNYSVFIVNDKNKSLEYSINDVLKDIDDIKFNKDIVYLRIGERIKIPTETNTTFISDDENILKVENDELIGVSAGTTYIYSTVAFNSLKVVVTDLITMANLSNKKTIPCNRYSEEESVLLDELLKSRISEVGYKSRAGAVEAARFLTLYFPYRIPYFYENGRVHKSGVNFVDGEGRYYHEGLYLHKNKTNDIVYKLSGPSIWGCPLRNWEPAPEWGFEKGEYVPNGLDCSGFVAWVLKNAGFDPGDVGAGETSYPYQMTDLGEYTPLTNSLLNSNRIKVGDLLNYSGHIAILIGISNDKYYVAESLQNYKGVVANTYTRSNLKAMFSHVVLMDNFYKNDGMLTTFW